MQEDLYDINGNAIAYIDYSDQNTIYLWNGVPVDYLDNSNAIYGFNGMHIGWYDQGYVRDLNGYIVGSNRQKCRVLTRIPPLKSLKHLKPLKSLQQLRKMKPIYKLSYSSIPLPQFLTLGSK